MNSTFNTICLTLLCLSEARSNFCQIAVKFLVKLINLMRHLHQSLNINKLEKLYNLQFDPKKITCHTCVTEVYADSRLRYATYFFLITAFLPFISVSKGFTSKFLRFNFSWNSRRQRQTQLVEIISELPSRIE